MNDADVLREQLIVRLDEIETEARDYLQDSDDAAGAVELDQTRQGRLSRMDAMQAQAMSQAARNRARQTLQRVAAARKRLDSPDYGSCLDCEEPIAAARLLYDPTTLRCLDCASARE
ncbi:TraR/DksA C4-type zinc finger protein [Salinisphaera sp. Q1T1-3]|uniref:TraR/DksA family transcriptional regulator n=1 Tax=Salinisphaera sp. Q1T1-3 TaxID=2321229 RepID=UPI000E72D6BE|nr:TraR/DksA C4-type zinc finger protein [Salinisphaera sp. Q1T1-3]RJS94854.1 TraR/DksA family transcriptional regulator [Salinisphaera sp. Q1T1-3]